MQKGLAKLDEALKNHVRVSSHPVVVRMVKPGEDLPGAAKHPLRDLGIKAAACQAIAMAIPSQSKAFENWEEH